jgi:general secretion pathway protein I
MAVRVPDAGFTLIETLVALAVLAVGAMALMTGVERHAAGTRGLADRVVARWVAENALAATTLGVAVDPRWTSALGVDWSVAQDARALPGTGLHTVTVRVAERAAGADASIVTLTGYLALDEGAQ